ncbi:helix-turn-helix domain-containing protein [Desulfobacter curvatus]|uniref:helix-turn-helix domain-containing protein n=1 Tax=Desulfobacter curvatus TaxID=2290 RepID=UPI000378E2B6|nr:XRE family transcriptional regulator [Desulfobacter curvatus]
MHKDLKFIGDNIRSFRQSRNWTLAQLASKIGIQEGPLGRIERGGNLPSATVIYNLAQALDIPTDALFAPDPSQARAAATKTDTAHVTIEPDASVPQKPLLLACRELMSAFHTLEDILGVQKHALLPLSIPFEPDYAGMEQLAGQVRTTMGTGDAVVFDYLELFENFGLRVLLFPFMKPSENLDGLSFFEPVHQNAFFFINSRKNPEKQLFCLATELGNILIFNQMKIRKDTLFPDTGLASGPRPINPRRAAKHFAATFLMPESAVRTTVGQLGIRPDTWTWDLILRIKHRFGISTEAFVYRLKELSLITEESTNTYIQKIKTHYKHTGFGEPDASRRILNANGRFFDLLLTAGSDDTAGQEIERIYAMAEELKLVII